jgi:hypothetical protein
MRLFGTAEYAARAFPLEATVDLSEWNLSWRNTADKAASEGGEISTLGALRARLRKIRP